MCVCFFSLFGRKGEFVHVEYSLFRFCSSHWCFFSLSPLPHPTTCWEKKNSDRYTLGRLWQKSTSLIQSKAFRWILPSLKPPEWRKAARKANRFRFRVSACSPSVSFYVFLQMLLFFFCSFFGVASFVFFSYLHYGAHVRHSKWRIEWTACRNSKNLERATIIRSQNCQSASSATTTHRRPLSGRFSDYSKNFSA